MLTSRHLLVPCGAGFTDCNFIHCWQKYYPTDEVMVFDTLQESNKIHTHSLVKAATQVWLAKGTLNPHTFHSASTDEFYGTYKGDNFLFTETTPYAPDFPFIASKASSDYLVRSYHETYVL